MPTSNHRVCIPTRVRLGLVCAVMSALMPGCSCNRTPAGTHGETTTGDSSAETEFASLPNLGLDDWALTDWAAKDLDHPPPVLEAELELIEPGLQVTTFDRKGPVHVVFRKELSDEFEVRARIVQPSVEELLEVGFPRPSRFPSLVGFRSAEGNPSFRTHLKRNRDVRETYEVVLRASRQQISFQINSQKPAIMNRSNLGSGHFFLEMPKNNQAYIVGLEVRTELDPDPVLVKAAERVNKLPPNGNGFAMQPPPGFFGPGQPMMGPGFSGVGPGFAGVGPPGAMGAEPPGPSRLEPLLTQQEWFVPKLGIQHLDTAIAQDVRLESSDDGSSLTFAKTAASGGFWMVRRFDLQGDFSFSQRVSVPSMQELASIAGASTLLAVGLYTSEDGPAGLVAPAPPPLPSGPRTFDFSVKCRNGRATLDVAGTPMGGSVTTDTGILVGLYVRGGIRFSVHDIDKPAATAVADTTRRRAKASPAEPSKPDTPQTPIVEPLTLRIWTDVSGTRQVAATFLKLAGDTAHFRRGDGTEVTIPLAGLCEADRLVVRELAAP